MDLIDRARILAFHRDRIAEFGEGTIEALGWKAPESQRCRFDVLAEIADLNDRSILDVGCGHGDMRAHLGATFPRLHYSGIEQIRPFLEVAVARYGDWPDTTFYLGDFSTGTLPEADYVLASGAMGYRSRDPDFVFRMITRLFGVCRLGFGFNLLRRVPHTEGLLVAYEPDPILAHCRQVTPHIVLRERYLEDDFTVFMYREPDAKDG